MFWLPIVHAFANLPLSVLLCVSTNATTTPVQYERDLAAGCAPESEFLTDPARTKFTLPGIDYRQAGAG